MKIRKATKKDLDALVELSYQLSMDQMNNCQVDFRLNKNFKTIQKRCISKDMKKRKNAFFVAEEAGEIVGYVSGKIEEDPPLYVDWKNGRVNGFYVKEGFRSKGLGKKLFAEMKKWFKKKKIKTIRLVVARCNIGAKRAYKSLGFGPADFEQWILKM
ncbi:GNAT family N-acetyltransferase [Candidatus Micrarchaeota archaeon]|nr:GNAT family N-acetyltransferase [Candidatus Micrarchaeota archaeon]MBD3418113.1 GNAT family N-acetyltransferase [Candidatus Micrarchaeota archaeon]